MARIAGIDLPRNKRGEIGLTYIYGIGRSTARKILEASAVSMDKKVQDWNDDDLSKIRGFITEGLKVEGSLRGQSTKNNSRTRKGKRKTVANKKKVTK